MLDNISIPFEIYSDQHRGGSAQVQVYYESFKLHLKNVGFNSKGSGTFRHGYVRNNIIIKVPRNGDGVIDNITEAFAYRKYRDRPTSRNIYLAPCRLLPNLSLMMVKVNYEENNYPFWTKNLVDGQYGAYKGKIVAYDYALDLHERFYVEAKLNVRSQAWHEEFAFLKKKLFETVFK